MATSAYTVIRSEFPPPPRMLTICGHPGVSARELEGRCIIGVMTSIRSRRGGRYSGSVGELAGSVPHRRFVLRRALNRSVLPTRLIGRSALLYIGPPAPSVETAELVVAQVRKHSTKSGAASADLLSLLAGTQMCSVASGS
jgi:hypothetical protein